MTKISKNDRIMVIGSCFAANIGSRLAADGFDVCLNPFGTVFNPASIFNCVQRMKSQEPFTHEECVEMGAGAGKICSFSHHTSFARERAEDFLENANRSLSEASRKWREADVVIVTYGTAQVWKHSGLIVSNCLKRPGYEFTHEMLSLEEVRGYTAGIIEDGKRYIFTVSPVRHMGEGANVNTISKATLQLALHSSLKENCSYFPAYEIMLDELRDYRWYAEDLVHPTQEAADYIYRKFLLATDAADAVDRG